MRKDVRKFLKKFRPDILEKEKKPKRKYIKRDKRLPAKPKKSREKKVPVEIIKEMIALRSKKYSWWSLRIWLYETHNIDLSWTTVKRKVDKAIKVEDMQ